MKEKTNYELIVRKQMASFIEKVFLNFGYSIDHEKFKQVLYGECKTGCSFEDSLKTYYDAYCYLISNSKNAFKSAVINKFFYILEQKEKEQSFVQKLIWAFCDLIDKPIIESAVDFHMVIYRLMPKNTELERTLISLMFLNYYLVKNNIPTIRIIGRDFDEYEKCKCAYLNGECLALHKFFVKIINETKFQDKSYYENLKPISRKDLFKSLNDDKDMLIKQCFITKMGVYGSFSRGENRIDSDIDLLVTFSMDLFQDEKIQIIDYLKQRYFYKFDRFIDVIEVSSILSDELLNEITNIKKII